MFDWVDDVIDVFDFGVTDIVEVAADVFADDEGGGQVVTMAPPTMSGNGGAVTRAGEFIRVGGGGAVSSMGVFPYIGRGVAAAGRGAAGVIAKWGKNMGAVLAGRGVQMRARDVLEIVKKYGPDVAAGVLGWTVAELMQVLGNLGAFTPKKRRRRGISARDVRTTKRVCGFVRRIQSDLADCARRAPARRGRGAGASQFVRQG